MTASSSQTRAFQAFISRKHKTQPPPPLIEKTATDEPFAFGRIPLSALRASAATIPSLSSPTGIIKPTVITQKRNSSTISLGNLLPRRKSLQTTALATRRQSLWMNIAKNASTNNDTHSTFLPLRTDHSSLMRKKMLRLLLVVSYLLSISLLAIALATFYGFFWSGYSTPQTTSLTDVKVIAQALISLTSNSTFVDRDLAIEDVSRDEFS